MTNDRRFQFKLKDVSFNSFWVTLHNVYLWLLTKALEMPFNFKLKELLLCEHWFRIYWFTMCVFLLSVDNFSTINNVSKISLRVVFARQFCLVGTLKRSFIMLINNFSDIYRFINNLEKLLEKQKYLRYNSFYYYKFLFLL